MGWTKQGAVRQDDLRDLFRMFNDFFHTFQQSARAAHNMPADPKHPEEDIPFPQVLTTVIDKLQEAWAAWKQEPAFPQWMKSVSSQASQAHWVTAGEGDEPDVPQEKDSASKELSMGRAVEKEHTDTIKWLIQKLGPGAGYTEGITDELLNEVVERIAQDHLKELPDYYTRLKKMESGPVNK